MEDSTNNKMSIKEQNACIENAGIDRANHFPNYEK